VKRFFINDVSLLIADILILLICIGGLYLITLKADLPFKTSAINLKLFVSENLVNNKNVNAGDEIISIGRSFLETSTAMIPYHRITKILYEDEVLFNRWGISMSGK
jgi:hypothetical protein